MIFCNFQIQTIMHVIMTLIRDLEKSGRYRRVDLTSPKNNIVLILFVFIFRVEEEKGEVVPKAIAPKPNHIYADKCSWEA